MFYLKLILSAVLQSYGGRDSGWVELRNTEDHPTASAVAGLIACCLGVRPGTPEYRHLLCLKYLSRTEKYNGILEDYQIVTPKEPGKLASESGIRTIDGKTKDPGEGQRPIRKRYLQDSSFCVLVGSEDAEELRRIHAAIRNPEWVYFLGRACCTPSEPVAEKDFRLVTPEEEGGGFVCI